MIDQRPTLRFKSFPEDIPRNKDGVTSVDNKVSMYWRKILLDSNSQLNQI